MLFFGAAGEGVGGGFAVGDGGGDFVEVGGADEALVANPAIYYWHDVPLMLMSYMGALKAWFYLALFSVVKPGAVSLRTPTVLFGAIAICLFFLLVDRTVGRRAAWTGALLLSTDSMFASVRSICESATKMTPSTPFKIHFRIAF